MRLPSRYYKFKQTIARNAMTLTVIGDDFDPVVLPDTHTSTEKERIVKKIMWYNEELTYEYVVPRSIPIAPSNMSSAIFERRKVRKSRGCPEWR